MEEMQSGLMLYSTCSLNPAEDEAVVAELLRRGAGSLELVDVSDKLPGLKRVHGINDWVVQDKGKKGANGPTYASFDVVPEDRKQVLRRSLFPPTSEVITLFYLFAPSRAEY